MDIKKSLQNLEKEEFIQLVKDLYALSKENKSFLSARFDRDNKDILLEYKNKVIEPFYPKRGGIGKLQLRPAKNAISDYKKASNDLLGTLDLMLTYVEAGTKFTTEYGYINENFYNSLESVLYDFKNLINTKSQDYLDYFRERLEKLSQNSDKGWGYGDTIDEVVGDLLDNK